MTGTSPARKPKRNGTPRRRKRGPSGLRGHDRTYLIERLTAHGVEHVFGIPGDYILTLYQMIEQSPIKLVNMTREDNAGFAADAYARSTGWGASA